MHSIIDVPSDISAYASQLAASGVHTVIRYYNHRNSRRLPTKCITPSEARALRSANLSIAMVFEERGGADGHIEDFNTRSGTRDASRASSLAATINQPNQSGIYFAVDYDYFHDADLSDIARYFTSVRAALAGNYTVGVYGSGAVGSYLKNRGLVDYVWLAGATGWSGTKQALQRGDWTLFQKFLNQRAPVGGFDHDGNIGNPQFENFGQFPIANVAISSINSNVVSIYEISARGGLNLRSGPGEDYRIVQSYPEGSVVHGLAQQGEWIKVDIQGDGIADGYMHRGYLNALSGGLPLLSSSNVTPIEVARQELALNVSEIRGKQDNPRIVMYHGTTKGGSAPDETAWCSSFVNYCVEQAGMTGTDDKWAMSWHDTGWGHDVTAAATEGDIAVFKRRNGSKNGRVEGGHVGFYLSQDNNAVKIIGGNQSNRISVDRYPIAGMKGSFYYELLSVRRG